MAGRTWRVVWSEAAAGELFDVVAGVARKSPEKARRFLARFRSSAGLLERTPRRGPIVPELASAGVREWRELAVDSCRMLYRVEDRTVRVGAVLDGSRDLEDLLLERLV